MRGGGPVQAEGGCDEWRVEMVVANRLMVGWGGGGVCSQRAVSGLVFGQNVLAAAQLFPQVGHLLAQGAILLLQEARPDGDLVLLQPPGIA